ncbi:hypothetical protein EYZ11_011306 [Aspergillus tanneri]|uniref:Cytochrome P450 n=1 Tax=Aspergillus tanneri TaxID=1220188 RepID=A0A4S3J343_9EURO|nr:hypothetical protein EYZ11_011306 [Aspergillus tanneri]
MSLFFAIFFLRYGWRTVIVIGSHQIAHDLLDKRNENYNSRPRFVIGDECMSKGLRSVYLPYGKKWKRYNHVHVSLLSPRLVPKYRIFQDLESKQLLYNMLHTNDFASCFHRYSASLIYTLAYGRRLSSSATFEVQEIKEISGNVSNILHSKVSLLVEAFPVLNLLPRPMARWRAVGDLSYKRAADFVKRNMMNAEEARSWNWVKEIVSSPESKAFTSNELAHAVGILFEAGSDSTPKVLEVFVLACVLFPNRVSRAQEEIDWVVGPEKLPAFSDKESLPYINAFVNEVLRWRPITPGGVPHATLSEDFYMGYRIPKDAIIVPSHWSLDLDDGTFQDPFDFQPERWIRNPHLPLSSFGFGRRTCPAQKLARNSLFIVMARLLWAYNISYCYENGKRVEVDPWDMTQGSLSGPSPFKASFEIRSPEKQILVERQWVSTEKDVEVLMNEAEKESTIFGNLN